LLVEDGVGDSVGVLVAVGVGDIVAVSPGVGDLVTVALGVAVDVAVGDGLLVAVGVGVIVGGIQAPKLTRTAAELVTRISNLSPVVDVYPIGFSRTRVYQPGARPANSNRPLTAVMKGGRAGGPGSGWAESYR
jgi:hypothetical protein